MRLLNSCLAFLALSVASIGFAAPVQETFGDDPAPASEDQFAHVCLQNSSGADALIQTSWNVGDDWYPLVLADGEQMIYRLAGQDLSPETKLGVKFSPADDCSVEPIDGAMDVSFDATRIDSCETLPNYKIATERDTGVLVLVKVEPTK